MLKTTCTHNTFTLRTKVNDIALQVGGKWCPPYYDEDEQRIICDIQQITRIYVGGIETTEEMAAAKLGLSDVEFRQLVLSELFNNID